MRNAIVDQILMERMNRRGGYDGRDYARGDYGRGGYDGRRGRDYGRDYARGGRDGRDGNYDEERFEDEDEKYLMEMQDGRRGVKGTGRGRRRGRRRDYGETLSLTKSDIMNWKHNLKMLMVPEVLILIWNKLWKQQKLSESGLKTLTKENFV